MARISRPPGFDMTYKPQGRTSFGPPIAEQLPAAIYFAVALALVGVILYGQHAAPTSSTLFQYVVEGDRSRMISSSVCAIVFFVSGLAAVLRDQMRGVVVHADGVEMRELAPLGVPRVRRLHWSQIDKLTLPSRETKAKELAIRLQLWDGTSAALPRVARTLDLARILERVALARAIPLEGGGLLDDVVEEREVDEEAA